MDIIVADVECFWSADYSLSHMTTESYVRDPRFCTNIWGFKINDTPAFTLLPDRARQFITQEIDWANTALIAQHAHFDGLVLSHHYGVKPAMWIDTLSMARAVDGPKAKNGLEHLAERYNLRKKDMRTLYMSKGKHLDDFSREEFALYCKYCEDDCENEYDLANIFLPQIPARELRLIDLTVRMFTEPRFIGDTNLLAAAVVAEKERKQALLDSLALDKKQFTSKDKFAELLKACDVEVPTKPSPTTGLPIYAFAKTDPGMQELLEHDDELVRTLAETRLSSTSNIIQTRAERFRDASLRGLMPVYLRYNGAHTDRWSGGDSTNYQNMTSQSSTRPEMLVLKKAHLAPEGYKVVSADSAQIEARFTVWLAGQLDMVEAFAQKRDVYSEFAGEQIYMRKVDRKKNPEDHIPGQLGKVSILGLGFALGYLKFGAELLKGMLGAPPIQFTMADVERMGIEPSRFLNQSKKVNAVSALVSRLEMNDRLIHWMVAEEIVNRWRNKNPYISGYDKNIQGLWDTHTHVINCMLSGQEFVWGPGGLLRTAGESILLPNGKSLKYRGLQADNGQASYFNGRERTKIYGGLLTENIVQALARIVVADQMLDVADVGYNPVTMTHDQFAVFAPDAEAEGVLQFMLQVMSTTPSWAPGLPLFAEGGMGQSYGDVK